MKKRITPIIALGLILIVMILMFIMASKEDVSETYSASDAESAEFKSIRQEAKTYQASKEFDRAIQYYKKALELRPDNAVVHNDLGSVYIKIGKKAAGPTWPTWESDLTGMSMETVIDEVSFALSDTDSGFIVFKAKDRDVINKVVKLANEAKCWTHVEANRINILKGKTMKKLLEAKDRFMRAVVIKPRYALAYRNLGALYYDIGKWQEGLKMMEHALELNPSDHQLRTYLEQFK